jgi:hypothetical protein
MGIEVLRIDRLGRTASLPVFKAQAHFKLQWFNKVRAWVEYGNWDEEILRAERRMNCFCYAIISSFAVCILSIVIKAIL